VDRFGVLFVADSGNHRVRRINLSNDVSTVAGPADLDSPQDVAVDRQGNLFVADLNNARVRKVAPDGTVTTLPGAGTELRAPAGLAVDSAGSLYVADRDGHRIVRINPAGQLTVLAGSLDTPGGNDGSGTEARFNAPSGLTVSSSGTIFVADRDNHRVRQVNLAARTVVAATGLNGTGPLAAEVAISGLEPDTLYYYRAIGSNGGGTVLSPSAAPYPTFTTLDNAASLAALTVNGEPVPGFDPCVYSYPLVAAAGFVLTATAESEDASIQLLTNGAFCCELQSGVPSEPLPLLAGPNLLQVEVLSADRTELRTYTLNITPQLSPFAQWREDNFASDAGNNAISGPTADPSGDEVDNLQKYAFGLDPNLNSTAGLPVATRGEGVITLAYNKLLAATDLTYEAQWSTNLHDWNSTGITEQVLGTDGVTQQVLATIPAQPGSRMFVRLALSLQQQ
jgi:hypothetical protein